MHVACNSQKVTAGWHGLLGAASSAIPDARVCSCCQCVALRGYLLPCRALRRRMAAAALMCGRVLASMPQFLSSEAGSSRSEMCLCLWKGRPGTLLLPPPLPAL